MGSQFHQAVKQGMNSLDDNTALVFRENKLYHEAQNAYIPLLVDDYLILGEMAPQFGLELNLEEDIST